MGPKGIGPQRLGVGQMGATCGCGVPKNCDCGAVSPAKIAPVAAMVGKALIGKAVEKVADKASPNKFVGFAARTLKKVGGELIGKGDLKRRNQYDADGHIDEDEAKDGPFKKRGCKKKY